MDADVAAAYNENQRPATRQPPADEYRTRTRPGPSRFISQPMTPNCTARRDATRRDATLTESARKHEHTHGNLVHRLRRRTHSADTVRKLGGKRTPHTSAEGTANVVGRRETSETGAASGTISSQRRSNQRLPLHILTKWLGISTPVSFDTVVSPQTRQPANFFILYYICQLPLDRFHTIPLLLPRSQRASRK